jgi:3-phosphoshikimate 1-carboxyvinyltransferase
MPKNIEIPIPGDKSISHRAVMLGSLARGESVIHNFLPSADCLATVDCFRRMGVEIESRKQEMIIKGRGLKGLQRPDNELYVGNSGTTIRLMMGILAGQEFVSRITGDESIQKRPMLRVAKPLREMGANIEGQGSRVKGQEEIFAPLKISGGKLKGIVYELPVASAQVKSAVLLAGLYAEGETKVIEKVPSRDHTERMLAHFGAASRKEFEGVEIDVPGDISSAAFFMVAALITPNSEFIFPNVGLNPTRTGIIEVLHRMGASLEVSDEEIICNEPRGKLRTRHSELKAIQISGEIVPRIIDEIPIIALAATQADGTTEIRGAKELRIKESDRIATISSELRKLGANIQELEDGMVIEGPTRLRGGRVKSFGDHRIAMMLSVAGLIADGTVEIDDTACIETSFPGFEKLFKYIP